MENAQEDLAATVEGRFSPEDWEKILDLAEAKWRNTLAQQPVPGEAAAWHDVVRDFHKDRYWGMRANYRPPKRRHLGYQFIWFTFSSLTIMKVAILWFGQIYSRSDEAKDLWMFVLVLAIVIGNVVFFLWRNRHHTD
jgi:hypothetical protein